LELVSGDIDKENQGRQKASCKKVRRDTNETNVSDDPGAKIVVTHRGLKSGAQNPTLKNMHESDVLWECCRTILASSGCLQITKLL